MASKKTASIIIIIFVMVVVAVILSLDSLATPDKNDDANRKIPGCKESGCHETEINNNKKDEPYLHVQVYAAEKETTVNVIFWSNNTTSAQKLEYEWNETTEKWDIPIKVGAELTEAKESYQAIVYDAKVGNGPNLTLTAPDGGTYWIRAGYYNKTEGVRVWTKVVVNIDYKNNRPTARAVFGGIEKGELVSSYGKQGDSSDDYPEKTAIFRFDDDGMVKLWFEADCTDKDEKDKDNLEYFWDFNDRVDYNVEEDKSDGIYTNDNDTSSNGSKKDVYFTFYQANHENNWEDHYPSWTFEPNQLYVINLSVTDNHLHRAWNWTNLNIMFHAPITYPDLRIVYAKFKTEDENKDGRFSIGEPIKVEVKITNEGKNSTGKIPFKLKFEDQFGRKMIPDYEEKDTLDAGDYKEISFKWTSTNLWADGVTKPKEYVEYNITITIDYENAIDEGFDYAEENNTLTIYNATYFLPPLIEKQPNLKIDKITLNGTEYKGGKYEMIQDYTLTINITIKNIGDGMAEIFDINVYLIKTDVISKKQKPKKFQRKELDPGESITITYDYVPSITSSGTEDNQTLRVEVIYKDNVTDKKDIKLLIKSETTNPPPSQPPPTESPINKKWLVPIIAIVAIVAVVVIIVVVRSRSYEYEEEEEEE